MSTNEEARPLGEGNGPGTAGKQPGEKINRSDAKTQGLSAEDSFREAMLAAGLTPPACIEPGRFHRFPGIGKRNGNTAGWCKLFDDALGGTFGDYSSGLSESWQARRDKPMSRNERAAFRRQVDESRKAAEEEKHREQKASAAKAQRRWDAAQPADPKHPHLTTKCFSGEGLRQDGSELLVDMRDESGQLWALQTIDPSRGKQWEKLNYPKGCCASGLYKLIGDPEAGCPICLTEGWGTAMAVYKATGYPVAAAFSAGNLEAVGRIFKDKFPNHALIFCADDDQRPDSDRNPGIEAATKAAKAVGGKLALPNMGRKADFWDVWDTWGPGRVKKAIEEALLSTGESNQKAKHSFALVKLSEIESKPPDWLVDGYLEVENLMVLVGDSGAGKSFAAVDLSCCIATRTPWHGCTVKSGPVLYLAGEGQRGLKKRFLAWGLHHNVDIDSAPIFLSNIAPRFNEESIEEVISVVDTIIEKHGAPSLIVVDTLSRSFVGNENDTADMVSFMQCADMLKSRFQATVMLLHHTGRLNKDRARGSYVLTCSVDFEYNLTREADGIVKLLCTKSKDHEAPTPMTFRLLPVELQVGEGNLDIVSSAVFEEANFEPPARKTKAGRGKNQILALDVLRSLFEKHRANLADAGHDPAGAKVTTDGWRQACVDAGIARNRSYEVCQDLEKAGAVRIENGFAIIC